MREVHRGAKLLVGETAVEAVMVCLEFVACVGGKCMCALIHYKLCTYA